MVRLLFSYAYAQFLTERKVLDLAEDDLNNRLQMTMTAVSTIRAAIGHIKDDYDILKLNITKLSNMTRY